MPESKGRDLVRALGIAAVVAIPISLVALAFLALVEQLTNWLWSDIPTAAGFAADSWWWVLLIPTIGGVLAGLAVRHLPGGGGHDPINGFSAKPVAPDAIPGVVLAALASLAFGAVIGPEAPLVALGSALGLWGAHLFRQSGNVAALAASAGLFAAISALFGNPLLAALLVLEAVGATALAAPLTVVVLPGLLAAGLGYIVFTGVGDLAGVTPTSLAVDGLASYPSLRLADVLWAVVIGVAMAAVGFAVRGIAARTHALAAPRPAVVGAMGGLTVGGLALVFGVSGESPLNVLFSGQSDLSTFVGQGSAWGAGIVALLILTKAAGYGVSLGSGFRGGPVFPALVPRGGRGHLLLARGARARAHPSGGRRDGCRIGGDAQASGVVGHARGGRRRQRGSAGVDPGHRRLRRGRGRHAGGLVPADEQDPADRTLTRSSRCARTASPGCEPESLGLLSRTPPR